MKRMIFVFIILTAVSGWWFYNWLEDSQQGITFGPAEQLDERPLVNMEDIIYTFTNHQGDVEVTINGFRSIYTDSLVITIKKLAPETITNKSWDFQNTSGRGTSTRSPIWAKGVWIER